MTTAIPLGGTSPTDIQYALERIQGRFADISDSLIGIGQDIDSISEQLGVAPIAPLTISSDYTLTSDDRIIRVDAPGAVNVTVPVDLGIPIGAEITISRIGAGTVTIVADTGVAIQTPSSLSINDQGGKASLVKLDDNEYQAADDLAAGSVTPPTTHTLTVTKSGTGSGDVTGPGIDTAASDFSEVLTEGTVANLTATPGASSIFKQWTGAVTDTSPTTSVTMAADETVDAEFDPSGTTSPGYVLDGTVMPPQKVWLPDAGEAVLPKWENVNPGPENKHIYHTSGGDPHPRTTGVVNPRYLEIVNNGEQATKDAGSTVRQQIGSKNSAGFHHFLEGDLTDLYFSVKAPSNFVGGINANAVGQIWEIQDTGGKPVLQLLWVKGNPLHFQLAVKPTDTTLTPLWDAVVPANTWCRFMLRCKWSKTAANAKIQLFGSLTANSGDPNFALHPLTSMLSGRYRNLGGTGDSGLIAGIYDNDGFGKPHSNYYANWELCRWAP